MTLPVMPRIERAGRAAGDEGQAVHQLDRRRAVVGLPSSRLHIVVPLSRTPLLAPGNDLLPCAVSEAGWTIRCVRKNPHENMLHDLNKTGPFRDRFWCMQKRLFFHAVHGMVRRLKSGG